MSSYSALIFVLLIGLSTILGNLILFIYKKKNNKIIGVSLAISAGVMIYLVLFDMLPEMFGEFPDLKRGILVCICLILGFVFSMVVDKLIPHHHEEMEMMSEKEESNHLMHIGIITIISVMLHNILEGIAIYTTSVIDSNLGISLGFGTIMHNIPLGFMIATVFYFTSGKKLNALKYTLIVALSTFMGGLLGLLIINSIGDIESILGYIIAVIAGTITYLIINELIPTAIEYCKAKLTTIVIMISILVMIIIEAMA